MLKIKIKTSNKIAFFLPVPYKIIKTASSILASKKFRNQMHKWANQDSKNKHVPDAIFDTILNKQLMNEMIRELSNHKGTVLVDAKLHDGTEVIVKL
ncbi:hypothetical protein [Mesobacillus selenatarsenatis]|uniref:Uncharacterized protein n=1 Tax=Mesobacillus selenatarsenatis (strain DSM 18680 / JCM 14380 / FERM P-15431 / SF-1) TaxID=1321606 RepID=A0A0A8X4X8_MESS1|nr:hypothetical protein [Mesobacillus selenatarsenatis]GAM14097.1 hypothetical protein SAMD00020551_2244 [Mesobacillus selenatarsenatis SF-1]